MKKIQEPRPKTVTHEYHNTTGPLNEEMHRSYQILQNAQNKMLILTETEVKKCLGIGKCIEVNRKALGSLRSKNTQDTSSGKATVPSRIALPYHSRRIVKSSSQLPDWTLFKPASYEPPLNKKEVDYNDEDVQMGMKIVSVRADNPSKNLPTVSQFITTYIFLAF